PERPGNSSGSASPVFAASQMHGKERSTSNMARYTGPRWKKSRRLGISLSGTGKEMKRPYPPGEHGPNQRRKISEYGLQLQEKQKLRYMYGLNEKQFRALFNEAGKL